MTLQKDAAGRPETTTDLLSALYRPLGLKAVLAAALMVKKKPEGETKKAA